MTETKRTPPPLGGRRTYTAESGGSGSGSISYSMALGPNNGNFMVTVTATPQVIGDDDWIGIYANQAALNEDIQRVNSGGSGGAYETWQWVTDFDQQGGSLTYTSSAKVNSGVVAGYFAKDSKSGSYRFVFQTNAF